MEQTKKGIIVGTVIALLVCVGGSAYGRTERSFHSGGAGNCEGCHFGIPGPQEEGTTGQAFELKGSDVSSTCLRCHASRNIEEHIIATDPSPATGEPPLSMTPGGDFAWLKKNFTYTIGPGQIERSSGERHGHNIVALDYGYSADTALTMAPGGSYPSNSLTCASCHDPHGSYRMTDSRGTVLTATSGGNVPNTAASGSYGTLPLPSASVGVYRLLGGVNYLPKSSAGARAFTANPPVAVSPRRYNRSENVTDTRVAYGSGMSEWCSNCHPNIHVQGSGHVSGRDGRLSAAVMRTYNSYKSSGDLTGMQADAYTSLVPYEEGTSDLIVLRGHAVSDGSYKSGPSTGSENVMCLSCHRAHASGWDSIMRWNPSSTFLVINSAYPANDAPTPEGREGQYSQGRSTSEVKAALYGRVPSHFASYQRSLCNKCHARD